MNRLFEFARRGFVIGKVRYINNFLFFQYLNQSIKVLVFSRGNAQRAAALVCGS